MKKRFDGPLLQRLISNYVSRSLYLYSIGDSILAEAYKIKLEPYTTLINNISNSVMKGAPVLNEPLYDKEDKEVRFSDFKGKVVFVDFWFTGCFACVAYYNGIL